MTQFEAAEPETVFAMRIVADWLIRVGKPGEAKRALRAALSASLVSLMESLAKTLENGVGLPQ